MYNSITQVRLQRDHLACTVPIATELCLPGLVSSPSFAAKTPHLNNGQLPNGSDPLPIARLSFRLS
jgi:hypothetical protein